MWKDKDLKKMSRKDLLKILVLQSKKNDELQEKLQKANELLETKKIMLSEAGSIAEASLKLNEVFEKAQQAADQYLENIKMLHNDAKTNLNNQEKTSNQGKNKTSNTKKKKGNKRKN